MFSAIMNLLGKLDDALENCLRRHPLVCLCLLVTLLGGAYLSYPTSDLEFDVKGPNTDSELTGLGKYLVDRPFFDKFPVDDRAKYEIYYFTKKGVAIYANLEYYKEVDEFFFYKALLGRMVYWFPHSKLKGLTKYTLEDCQGPGTFNVKLTLHEDPKGNKKKRVFYSWKQFKRDSLPKKLNGKLENLVERADGVTSPQ